MVLYNFLIIVTQVFGNYQSPNAVSCDYLYWHFIPKRALSHYRLETQIQHSYCQQTNDYCYIWLRTLLKVYFTSASPNSPKVIYFF